MKLRTVVGVDQSPLADPAGGPSIRRGLRWGLGQCEANRSEQAHKEKQSHGPEEKLANLLAGRERNVEGKWHRSLHLTMILPDQDYLMTIQCQ